MISDIITSSSLDKSKFKKRRTCNGLCRTATTIMKVSTLANLLPSISASQRQHTNTHLFNKQSIQDKINTAEYCLNVLSSLSAFGHWSTIYRDRLYITLNYTVEYPSIVPKCNKVSPCWILKPKAASPCKII